MPERVWVWLCIRVRMVMRALVSVLRLLIHTGMHIDTHTEAQAWLSPALVRTISTQRHGTQTHTHTHTHMVKAPHLVLISQIVVRFALFGLSQWNYL